MTRVFGWVSFFQDLGSKMLVPIVPLFLTQVLGAPPVAVGLADGVGSATASVWSSVGGRMADRGRPLRLVRLGYALSSVAKLLLAFVWTWPAVVAVRLVDRVGKGTRDAPRDLLLARQTRTPGAAFGFQQAMDKAGGTLGPLIGLVAFQLAGERFRPLFVVAFVPCAISVALLWLIRSEPDAHAGAAPTSRIRVGGLGRAFWWRVAPFAAVGAARLGDGLLVLRVDSLGASTSAILMSFAAMRATNAIAAYPCGLLADRVAPAPLVAVGGLGLAIVQGAMALAGPGLALMVLIPAAGLVAPLLRVPTKLAVLAAANPAQRGRALGAVETVVGVAALGVAAVAGLAWSGSGSAPFAAAGAFTLAGAGWTWTRRV